jgi:glycosyltransferase involved in cell wall biosynthesis
MSGLDAFSKISLIVITLNEEDVIERCLESASGVGEIIVVDSFSTDGTVARAERMGARVYQREYISAADQKNWAMEKATLDWILILDADEHLSPELREEIGAAVADPSADGYWLRRRNSFFGRTIRYCGWQNDRVLRFFKRGCGIYPERAVHEKLELTGRAAHFRGYLDHTPYRDIDDYIERMKSYSRRSAEELRRSRRNWFPAVVLNPPARFFRMYVLQLGFLDGAAGLVLCFLAAVSVFFKYARLKELSERDGRGEGGK